jgi:rhamnogalacturonyl hydrolase YesR
MLCPDDAPGYETSGTAFFTYGLLWGVNNSILDKKTYQPVIDKAWKYLYETALQPDGSIGYVQPIGEKPDPTKTVNAQSQSPFGTGAWLLAACEYLNYNVDRSLEGRIAGK